jgi:23S rRNA (uracil1939-C5)-methyltransferase
MPDPGFAAGDAHPAIRAFVEPFVPAKKPVRVTALLTRGGLDINLEGAQPPSPRALPSLTAKAEAAGIVRLSLNGEPILSLGEAAIEIAGCAVTPPPGAFVQASAEAETIMADIVLTHLAGARKVADLFCGVGTFALALARHSAVLAVENNPAALDALSAGLRTASRLKRVETERRDLFTFPLSATELNAFDAVVFDPPRTGAKVQAEALAASKVPRLAAVSCNPASFARDARILLDGGYALSRVIPVDQFVFSAETEVVGLFERPPRAGRAAR